MGDKNSIQLYEYNTTFNLLIIANGWYQFTFIRKYIYIYIYTFSIIYKLIGTCHDLKDTDDNRNLIQLNDTTS